MMKNTNFQYLSKNSEKIRVIFSKKMHYCEFFQIFWSLMCAWKKIKSKKHVFVVRNQPVCLNRVGHFWHAYSAIAFEYKYSNLQALIF